MYAINIAIKLVFFLVFTGLITLILEYFLNKVKDNLNIPFLDLLTYLGVIEALQILISFAIASFVANHVIAYFRS